MRGWRQLFPKLPSEYRSRLLRLAMSWHAWERLERLVARSTAPTLPRAYGEVVEHLLAHSAASSPYAASPSCQRFPNALAVLGQEPCEDWQVWQIQKGLALLATTSERGRGVVGQESMN
jgi:hypothetical protein